MNNHTGDWFCQSQRDDFNSPVLRRLRRYHGINPTSIPNPTDLVVSLSLALRPGASPPQGHNPVGVDPSHRPGPGVGPRSSDQPRASDKAPLGQPETCDQEACSHRTDSPKSSQDFGISRTPGVTLAEPGGFLLKHQHACNTAQAADRKSPTITPCTTSSRAGIRSG